MRHPAFVAWTVAWATISTVWPGPARCEEERAGHVVMLYVNLPQAMGFDVRDRVVLWRQEEGLYPPLFSPRRTPDGRVFLEKRGERIVGPVFRAGTLDRIELGTGKVLSSRKVKHMLVYGFAREDRLFLMDSMSWGNLDQKDRSKLDYVPGVELMAFDTKTGKELWSSSPAELQPEKPAGCNARLRWADDHLIVILEADGVARVAKIAPSTGEVVWVQDVE